jgi:arylsulfatase
MPASKTASGVIVANGGRTGGCVLYTKNGKPVFEFNNSMIYRHAVVSTQSLNSGKHIVKTVFQYDGGGTCKGGMVTLLLMIKKVGEVKILSSPAYAYIASSLAKV